MPVPLWPVAMAMFLFNQAWFSAGGTEYETIVRGYWAPVPAGARVLYFPSNNKDVRTKRDRYLGDSRMGIFAGYGEYMIPKRSNIVIDEHDLLH